MAAEGDRPAAEPSAEATGRDASAQDRPAPDSGVDADADAPAPPSGQRPGWSPGERGAPARPGSGGQGRPAPGQSGRGGPRRGGPSSDRPSGPPDRGPRDDRRRRRDGREGQDRRPFAGFGDAVERSFCLAFQHAVPPAFPVQHRHGVATLRVTVVARRPEAILLCDGGHPGPHRWPDGEPVGSDYVGSEGAVQAEPVAESAADRDERQDQRTASPADEES